MPKNLKIIACEAVKTELEALIPQCGNIIDREYMTLGLHSFGKIKMVEELQAAIDRAILPGKYDALILVYGLCNNGIVSLRADIPMVVPRAHDCITLFMGSRQGYRKYFDEHPGTYFITSGTMNTELHTDILIKGLNKERLRAEYAKKYGEEDADYLVEALGDPLKQYRNILFINNGVGDSEKTRAMVKSIAQAKSWSYDECAGDNKLLKRLLDGDWDPADFLTIPPGKTIAQAYTDEEIIKVGD